MDNPIQNFNKRNSDFIQKMSDDKEFKNLSNKWIDSANSHEYSYHFEWMGRPIIQYPQDMIAIQELIWNVKPDLIIETGIAHGGSIVFSASILKLLEIYNLVENPKVVGVDIDIRSHNRELIENHPTFELIEMIEDSSVSPDVINQLEKLAEGKKRIIVFLDSNHTHDHVLAELTKYSKFVSKDSYLVCFDTYVEDLPKGSFPNRPWDVGNNPKTAVKEFLKNNDDFKIDKVIENKLMVTVAPDGYLKRVK